MAPKVIKKLPSLTIRQTLSLINLLREWFGAKAFYSIKEFLEDTINLVSCVKVVILWYVN